MGQPEELVELPGVNVQWPWSERLLSGDKTVETRRYPLPERYLDKPLALIETPGPNGPRNGVVKARIIGTITFTASVPYQTRAAWLADAARHRVAADDAQFAFQDGVAKWGWVVASVQRFAEPQAAPLRKGIVFTSACPVPAHCLEHTFDSGAP